MSSKLLAQFDVYYQASSEVPKPSPSTSLPGANTNSVFDDLASLDKQSVEQSNKLFGKATGEPLSWSENDGNLKTLQPSNVGQLKNTTDSGRSQSFDKGSGAVVSKSRRDPAENESNTDVLFDALEEMRMVDEEDEFGDFESGDLVPPTKASNSSTMAASNASSYDDVAQGFQGLTHDSASSSHAEPRNPLLLQERNPFEELLISTEHVTESTDVESAATPVTAWPSYVVSSTQSYEDSSADGAILDDGWGDFIGPAGTASTTKDTSRHSRDEMIGFSESRPSKRLPSTLTAKPAPFVTGKSSAISNLSTDDAKPLSITKLKSPLVKAEILPVSSPDGTRPLESSPAPPNIPPPSILLPLLTTIFQHQCKTLDPFKDQAPSPSSTIESVHDLLITITVAARIIAGRKLRWKRDTLLAQSMKIGPAHSGKAGGMKLTGIDKAESLKEDREVADVVRVWKEHLGRIRAAAAAVKSSGAGTSMSIPTLAESMLVRTAREGEGALTAMKACALCGLKREERVDKVDERVEDSFGEWWVDHWGHVLCKGFWDQHHNRLRQR